MHDDLVSLIEAVRALPYGRPRERSIAGMLHERRGTCSTKHLHLANELRRRFAASDPRIVHRVYRVDRALARARFGDEAAAAVPAEGLIDVHRYLTILVDGGGGSRVIVDATFPGAPAWDGRSSMTLACGDGEDHAAGEDPDADKRALEAAHCDPRVREPFILALARR